MNRSRCHPSPEHEEFRADHPALMSNAHPTPKRRLSRLLLRAFEYYDGSVPIQAVVINACYRASRNYKSGRYDVVRCPVRSLDLPMEAVPDGLVFPASRDLKDLNALSSVHPECLVSHPATSLRCLPLQTGVQAIQLSPYTSCPDPPRPRQLKRFGPFPSMLLSPVSFEIAAITGQG